MATVPEEVHYFSWAVSQSQTYGEDVPRKEIPQDVIPVVLYVFKQIKTISYTSADHPTSTDPPTTTTYGTPKFEDSCLFWLYPNVRLHSHRNYYRKLLSEILSKLVSIPPHEHHFIRDEILKVADLVPIGDDNLHIHVAITDITVQPLLTAIVETDQRDIINRGEPCVICFEDFGGEGSVDQTRGNSITRLPCLHYYHQHCIAPWLEKHHVCPLCRAYFAHDDQDPNGGNESNIVVLLSTEGSDSTPSRNC